MYGEKGYRNSSLTKSIKKKASRLAGAKRNRDIHIPISLFFFYKFNLVRHFQ